MRARSSLSAEQREELVTLFEKGFGYRAAAYHVGVYPVRALFRRFLLHGKLCLVETFKAAVLLRDQKGSCPTPSHRRVKDESCP